LGEDILLYVSRESVTGQRSNQLNYVPTLFSLGSLETLDFPVFSYCR